MSLRDRLGSAGWRGALVPGLALALSLGGCSFNTAGLSFTDAHRLSDAHADRAPVERLAADTRPADTLRRDTLRPDTLRPDTLRPDTLGPDAPSCPTGQIFCSGACVAQTRGANCGACGTGCNPDLFDSCTVDTSGKGACTCSGTVCGAGKMCCKNACVDATASPNCGGCGYTCTLGNNCVPTAAGAYVCSCATSGDCQPYAPTCGRVGTQTVCECGTTGAACDWPTTDGCTLTGACACVGLPCTFPPNVCYAGTGGGPDHCGPW